MKVKELMELLDDMEVETWEPHYKGYSTTILKWEFEEISDSLYEFIFEKDYKEYKKIWGSIREVLKNEEISNSEVLKIKRMELGQYIQVSQSGNKYCHGYTTVVIVIK